MAQRYGTMATHTRLRASLLFVFVIFLRAHVQLIRRTPPPTFSYTAIIDRHSDTSLFQLRAHWVRISWSIGSEDPVRTRAACESRTLELLRERRTPNTPLVLTYSCCVPILNMTPHPPTRPPPPPPPREPQRHVSMAAVRG